MNSQENLNGVFRSFSDLNDDFSSSYTDGKNYKNAEILIDEYLKTKGIIKDGYMLNLNTLPILLSNVLDVYSENRISFHVSYRNDKEYLVKISILGRNA